MDKKANRNRWSAALVQKTAIVWGVSHDYVRKIIRGDRDHDGIMGTYMEFLETENELLKKAKELVKVNKGEKRKRAKHPQAVG